jgi:hypothetical protein
MQVLSRLSRALFLGWMITLCACATRPDVRIDMEPGIDLAKYRTFAFFDGVSTDVGGYTSLYSAQLKQSTRRELERLGFTYAESDPELRINFFLRVIDKQRLSSTPSGYYSYRAGRYGTWGGYPYVETVEYREGTLSIDLVDAKRNQLVWQGVAEGEVKDESMKKPGPALDKVVTQVFSNFPNPPK